MKTITVDEFKKLRRRSAQSELEDHFAAAWEDYAVSQIRWDARYYRPERQLRFLSARRWRFDFAWEIAWVAVEISGGTYSRGAHVRGVGYQNDCDKANAALLAGWKVLRFTGDDIKRRLRRCCEMVGDLL